MTNDEILGDVIVRFAVLEQLTLNLAGAMARQARDPREAVDALISDLRDQFSEAGGNGPGDPAFIDSVGSHLDVLEQRLFALVPAAGDL